jgi:hydroxypyruvate isomerase
LRDASEGPRRRAGRRRLGGGVWITVDVAMHRRPPMSWKLRYAAHLGFRSFEQPLFRASVGSLDLEAHVAFTAGLRFAGVQDPWFAQRSSADQDRLAASLRGHGVAAGCVVCGAFADVRGPLWTGRGVGAREQLRASLDQAVQAALKIGANSLAVLSGEQPGTPRVTQFTAMIDNLVWASEVVAPFGLTLCLEPTNARTLPGMFLSHINDARDIVRQVASPSVRLIFDTAHVQSMDGDLLNNLDRCWTEIEVIQIANHPGRYEPDCGEINMPAILREVRARGYRGLVELEHVWSQDDKSTEQRGIEWLRRVDAAL